MKQLITFLKNIPLVFYSAPFYRALANEGKGIGLSFIVFVTFLNMAATAPSIMSGLDLFGTEQKELLSVLPDMKIQKGELSIIGDKKQTFNIMNEQDEGPLSIVFDMEAEPLPTLEMERKMKDEKIVIWINKELYLIFDYEAKKLQREYFDELDDIAVTHEDWVKLSEAIASWSGPTLIMMIGLFSFISHFILTIIGGFLLWIAAPLFKRELSFDAGARITAAAKVPVAFLGLLLPPVPLFQSVFWLGFALFGLLSVKRKETAKG